MVVFTIKGHMNSKLSKIVSLAALVVTLAGARQAIAQSAPASKAPPATLAGTPAAKPWTGDFDGMVKRRLIRILTPYSKTHYFIDRGVQRGLVFDAGTMLEAALNKKLKTGLTDRPERRVRAHDA